MNNTRKAIMEKIEPFMDKTLDFGCIISFKKFFKKIEYGTFIKEGESNGYIETVCKEFKLLGIKYKILGHYDITAVLKYIESIIGMKKWKVYHDCLVLEENNNGKMRFIKILLKPLHLYTEQEEKDLLELLNLLDK